MTEAEREMAGRKDDAILSLLAKISLLYWRPDYTQEQAAEVYSMYLEDLREYAFRDIFAAVGKYRRDTENKFFPLPGQLRGLIELAPAWESSQGQHIAKRKAAAREEMQAILAGDTSVLLLAQKNP